MAAGLLLGKGAGRATETKPANAEDKVLKVES
jgi:hypothetical protein